MSAFSTPLNRVAPLMESQSATCCQPGDFRPALMELLYGKRYSEFIDGMDKLTVSQLKHLLSPSASSLLTYSLNSPLRASERLRPPDDLSVTPMLELCITGNLRVVSRAVELLSAGAGVSICRTLRPTLFQLVDFCCCSNSSSSPVDTDSFESEKVELKLAELFAQLAIVQPSRCLEMLNHEATSSRLRPAEYAALWRKFHLARVFLEAPGYIRTVVRSDRVALDEFHLTPYHWYGGARMNKSPFLYFTMANERDGLDGRIPDSWLTFYNSPVPQAYFNAIQELVPKSRHAFTETFFLIVCYFLTIITMTARVFTRGEFNSSRVAQVAGLNETHLVFLTQLPQAGLSVMQGLFYARFVLQLSLVLGCAIFLTVSFCNNRMLPPAARRNWLPLQWITNLLNLSNVSDSLVASSLFFHLGTLCIEAIYIYTDYCYTVENGQLYISADSLKFMYTIFMLMMQHTLILSVSSLSYYYEIFAHILIGMQQSTKILYIGFFPVIVFSATVLICYPYLPDSSVNSAFTEYLASAFRFIFGQAEFVGPAAQLLVWVQPVYYVFIAVFLLNFCVALITQKIAELDQTIGYRQRIQLLGYWHLHCLAVHTIRTIWCGLKQNHEHI